MLDTNGDGVAEVLVSDGSVFEVYQQGADRRWIKIAVTAPSCVDDDFRAKLGAIPPRMAPPPPDLKDVVIGGRSLRLVPPPPDCVVERIVVTGSVKR